MAEWLCFTCVATGFVSMNLFNSIALVLLVLLLPPPPMLQAASVRWRRWAFSSLLPTMLYQLLLLELLLLFFVVVVLLGWRRRLPLLLLSLFFCCCLRRCSWYVDDRSLSACRYCTWVWFSLSCCCFVFGTTGQNRPTPCCDHHGARQQQAVRGAALSTTRAFGRGQIVMVVPFVREEARAVQYCIRVRCMLARSLAEWRFQEAASFFLLFFFFFQSVRILTIDFRVRANLTRLAPASTLVGVCSTVVCSKCKRAGATRKMNNHERLRASLRVCLGNVQCYRNPARTPQELHNTDRHFVASQKIEEKQVKATHINRQSS